jgi:hypothetical protein
VGNPSLGVEAPFLLYHPRVSVATMATAWGVVSTRFATSRLREDHSASFRHVRIGQSLVKAFGGIGLRPTPYSTSSGVRSSPPGRNRETRGPASFHRSLMADPWSGACGCPHHAPGVHNGPDREDLMGDHPGLVPVPVQQSRMGHVAPNRCGLGCSKPVHWTMVPAPAQEREESGV